jgi:multicomponent K+:H+ antiporter subunit A
MIGWLAKAAAPSAHHLALWHGLNSSALWMSVFAFGGGILVLNAQSKLASMVQRALRFDGKAAFDISLIWLTKLGVIVRDLHNGMLHRYVAVALLGIVIACVIAGYGVPYPELLRGPTPVNPAAVGAAGALIFVTAAAVRMHHQRMIALLLTGIAGLLIAIGFAYFSAPDLALTQIGIEVVTVILMLLALNYLPKSSGFERGFWRRGGDAAIAILAGAGTAMLAFVMLRHTTNQTPISAFHLAQSKPGAGGTNAVNTIIVDFRGFDTYGEIIVLGIAALIVAAVVAGLPQTPVPTQNRSSAPLMLRVASNMILPFSVMIGIYIFLRGHNQPGGGFVAGLIFAFGFLLQYMTFGLTAVAERKRIGHHTLIGAGILVASSTGIASWFVGRPFLTSNHGYVHLIPLEKFELATASLFDLGVFLCVLGAVLLSLVKIARISAPSARGD